MRPIAVAVLLFSLVAGAVPAPMPNVPHPQNTVRVHEGQFLWAVRPNVDTEAAGMSYVSAVTACGALRTAGKTWRLATTAEMGELVWNTLPASRYYWETDASPTSRGCSRNNRGVQQRTSGSPTAWFYGKAPKSCSALCVTTQVPTLPAAQAPATLTEVTENVEDTAARIVSYRGVVALTHPAEIEIRPDEMYNLTADVISLLPACSGPNADLQTCLLHKRVEEFEWAEESGGRRGVCDSGSAATYHCFGDTHFEKNEFGVNYYVPHELRGNITITVKHKPTQLTDRIVLRPAAGTLTVDQRPRDPVASLEQYRGNNISPDTALTGQGRWVYVTGERFWVPYAYTREWVPYRHGYWSWADGYGFTWVSYDPWGWYTDHYGAWRHHVVYGWMWAPFSTPVYRPHTATFFYSSGYVGWYPYYSYDTSFSYSMGHLHGFDDGYSVGYRNGRADTFSRVRSSSYRPGATMVTNNNFTTRNVTNVYVSGDRVNQVFEQSHLSGHAGNRLANLDPQNRTQNENWLRTQTNDSTLRLTTTTMSSRTIGGTTMYQPASVHQVPANYLQNYQRDVRGQRSTPAPVGSLIAAVDNRTFIQTPSTNGIGLAPAPRITTANQQVQPLARNSSAQPVINPNAGNVRREVISTPATPPRNPTVTRTSRVVQTPATPQVTPQSTTPRVTPPPATPRATPPPTAPRATPPPAAPRATPPPAAPRATPPPAPRPTPPRPAPPPSAPRRR